MVLDYFAYKKTTFTQCLKDQGKNPFVLDSKEPDWRKFQVFLMNEVRYTSLKKSFPKDAEMLFAASEEMAKRRFNSYKCMTAMDFSTED